MGEPSFTEPIKRFPDSLYSDFYTKYQTEALIFACKICDQFLHTGLIGILLHHKNSCSYLAETKTLFLFLNISYFICVGLIVQKRQTEHFIFFRFKPVFHKSKGAVNFFLRYFKTGDQRILQFISWFNVIIAVLSVMILTKCNKKVKNDVQFWSLSLKTNMSLFMDGFHFSQSYRATTRRQFTFYQ